MLIILCFIILIIFALIGSNNIDIILQFSGWVLEKYPEEGLTIFTEDVAEVEQLSRPKILDFLIRNHKNLVIPYLEHVIHVWNDSNAICHNALIHQYREKLQQYKSMSMQADEQSAQNTKTKLLEFLEQSKCYTPETVLVHFPLDGNNLHIFKTFISFCFNTLFYRIF